MPDYCGRGTTGFFFGIAYRKDLYPDVEFRADGRHEFDASIFFQTRYSARSRCGSGGSEAGPIYQRIFYRYFNIHVIEYFSNIFSDEYKIPC